MIRYVTGSCVTQFFCNYFRVSFLYYERRLNPTSSDLDTVFYRYFRDYRFWLVKKERLNTTSTFRPLFISQKTLPQQQSLFSGSKFFTSLLPLTSIVYQRFCHYSIKILHKLEGVLLACYHIHEIYCLWRCWQQLHWIFWNF